MRILLKYGLGSNHNNPGPLLVLTGVTGPRWKPLEGEAFRRKLMPMSGSGVRRAKAALSNGCKPHPATAPAGAIGAVMEITKWLKPSIKSVGLCDRPPPLDFRFTPLDGVIGRPSLWIAEDF